MNPKFIIIIFLFLFFLNKNIYASSSMNLIINDSATNIVTSEKFNGDYFVPLRNVITGLGGEVYFDPEAFDVIFSLNDKMFSYNMNHNKIKYVIDGSTYSFNNSFDIRFTNGRCYVSLSFLQRFFHVSFEKKDKSLFISSQKKLSNNFTIKPLLITHAGGLINNVYISNSLEAITNSINNGSRFIELDFLKTYDNKYVLGHDWGTVYNIFEIPSKRYTSESYTSKKDGPLTPISMDDLISILDNNPDLSIITDTKDDNNEFLQYIFDYHSSYMNQFIPQVYSLDEYKFAKSLGFKDIIYSLYKVYLTDDEIFSLAKNNNLFAITLSEIRAKSGLAKRLGDIGVMTYVHTINDLDLANQYQSLGVGGFYTDKLY